MAKKKLGIKHKLLYKKDQKPTVYVQVTYNRENTKFISPSLTIAPAWFYMDIFSKDPEFGLEKIIENDTYLIQLCRNVLDKYSISYTATTFSLHNKPNNLFVFLTCTVSEYFEFFIGSKVSEFLNEKGYHHTSIFTESINLEDKESDLTMRVISELNPPLFKELRENILSKYTILSKEILTKSKSHNKLIYPIAEILSDNSEYRSEEINQFKDYLEQELFKTNK